MQENNDKTLNDQIVAVCMQENYDKTVNKQILAVCMQKKKWKNSKWADISSVHAKNNAKTVMLVELVSGTPSPPVDNVFTTPSISFMIKPNPGGL